MIERDTKLQITSEPAIAYSTCCAQVFSRLFFGDCLIESDKIESGSVDLILTDLPYGTVEAIGNSDSINHGMKGKTAWDVPIEPKDIYSIANRILRKNGKMILFAQEPYTNLLINETIPNLPFCYRMIWEKDHFANSLIAKKAPVSYYEDILVFSKNEDTEWMNPLRDYAVQVLGFIGRSRVDVFAELGKGQIRFFRIKQDEFAAPTSEVYQLLIEKFGIDKMAGFKTYNEIIQINNKYKQEYASTFNLWEGKKYKSNILKYAKDYDGYHPTQKPILLLEDLIKTFSNEGNLVVDLTMGSGSTGVACKNTNRSFIGIEKDENYFKIAEQRIKARTLFS